MTRLYKSFRSTILRQHFIESHDNVLIGASGGVDSMALAHLLLRLKKTLDFQLGVAHVNYGLRGKESDDQESLVRDFASKNNLPCFVTKAALVNNQSSARDFRYHYFAEVAGQIDANKVAVAHHLEDQVETILAQWLRGASLKGLGGMKPIRELGTWNLEPGTKVLLIRPLLSSSKEELKAYAAQNQIPFIEDSSNTSDKYWRNRLRHELLPVIQKLRPRAFEKIVRLGDELKELGDYLGLEATDWLKEFGRKDEKSFWIPRPRFAKLPKALRLEILHQAYVQWSEGAKDLKQDHLFRCDQMSLGTKSEGSYPLPHSIHFVRSGNNLILR